MTRLIALLVLLVAMLPAMAQDSAPENDAAESSRSVFTTFIENRLSTPNRKIRLSGIRGALSSEASIGEITVADREGVWLRIVDASIVWSRTALLLRQRLEIDRLGAERIEVLRRPLPAKGLPAPESRSFQVPELPVAINLNRLEVPSASFAEDIFGLASELSLDGALSIAGGTLDTTLDIQRLDGPGGHFALNAAFSNETEVLELDLALDEPADGVVANLLQIEGRPPLSLTVAGSGPLSALDVKLALAADGVPTFGGTMRFRQREDGLGFSTRLAGPIARLVPARFRGFFGSGTVLTAEGLSKQGGGLLLRSLHLSSGSMQLEAAAETGADGFLTALSLNADIAEREGGRVLLPVAGGETSLQKAHLDITYGEAGSERWNGALTVDDLQTAQFAAGSTELSMGGFAQNLNSPEQRRISFAIDGGLRDIIATRADIAEALGKAVTLEVAGDWRAGTPVSIERASLSGNGLALSLAGTVDDFVFDGDLGISAASLAPFSDLAGQELGGSVDFEASGQVMPISGGFDLALDGTATDLRLENAVAGPLLAGQTTVSGGVARTEAGLTARKLRLANEQVTFEADGTYATGAADFGFDAALADLALLTGRAEGRLTASGRAEGADGRINIALGANVPRGTLTGKTLNDADISFDGQLEAGSLVGQILGDAFLAGERATLSGGVLLGPDRRQLSDFSFSAGGARADGDIRQDGDGLLTGDIAVDAPDIATAAALFLAEARGSARADIALRPDAGRQRLEANATLADIVVDGTRVAEADLEARVADLFGVPVVAGTLRASGIEAAGFNVTRLTAEAESDGGETTRFSAETRLQQGTRIATRGALSPEDGGYRLALDRLTLDQNRVSARLAAPTSLRVEGRNFTLAPLALTLGDGRITAEGTVADRLELDIAMDRVPLSVANAIRPDLALGGTIDGSATVRGTRENPQIAFDVAGRRIAAAALGQAGLSTVTLDAKGTTRGDDLSLNTTVTSPEGLRASAKGSVPLGAGNLALDVALNAFPLSVLDRVVPNQQLAGQLTGEARLTGTHADPRATFDLRANGLNATALSDTGLGPLTLSANGRYAGDTIRLDALAADGPTGLSVRANGTVPLAGNGLAVNVEGGVPLEVGERFLASRGTQFSGTVTANARITGALRDPVINGTVATANAVVVDPLTNLRLDDIRLGARVEGERVVIQEGSAALSGGGRINLSGSVSTDAAAGFPADLRIGLDEARYTDGEMVTATLSGGLTLNGALTRDPLLAGEINIARAEIIVPESLGGSVTALPVKHRDAPAAVRETLERARADDGTPMPSSRPSVMRLDITVNAPARIFVRGRGLDAELGGSVRLTGPVTGIQPVGAFDLIRGRLSIIGQRITFEEGRVTLVGDLDPQLDFLARSQSEDIVVYITVKGRVSELHIGFSSQPELPEDEVLARLIFNRGVDDLSPVQLAQLAAAAAELAGGANTSLLGSLRSATGLDELDIISDSEGNTAVRAGRYIQENIYLGVEAGSRGTTRGTINLDISDSLKARGAVGSDGDSSIGVFFERDY